MFRVLLRAYKDALYKMGDKQVYLVSGKDINQSVLKNLFKNFRLSEQISALIGTYPVHQTLKKTLQLLWIYWVFENVGKLLCM